MVHVICYVLMGKRELVALFSLSSWCLVMVVWLFLAVSWVCLRFVIVVFSDHTHYFCGHKSFLLRKCNHDNWRFDLCSHHREYDQEMLQ